jgi:hypothetical protein
MDEDDENQRPSQEGTERNLGAEVDAYQHLYDLARQLQQDRGLTTAQLLGLVHVLAADLARELTNAAARLKSQIRTKLDVAKG